MMEIVKLDSSHKEMVKGLFSNTKYMGMDYNKEHFTDKDAKFMEMSYNVFCDTYLSDLKNYKAFGSIENGVVTAFISFYEPTDTADWYGTQIRSMNRSHVAPVLDHVLAYNESNGRLKFYSMINLKYAKGYRRFAFSPEAQERYEFVDELIVPAKTKCYYQAYWYLLFNRTLVPTDSMVKCTFLKQKYRTKVPIGGNL